MSRINDEMDKQILEEQAATNRLLTDSFFFNDQKKGYVLYRTIT